MTVGEMKQILAPLDDRATLFIDAADSEEITEVCSAAADDEGDLIISDYYPDEDEDEDGEEIPA